MSENTTPTPTETPNAGAGSTAEPTGQPGQQPGQPFAVFETEQAFMQRLNRAARSEMNKNAKALGFDSWTEMQEALAALRPAAGVAAPAAPATPAATPPQPAGSPDEVARLRMALQVGAELNLPTALVMRLQGGTLEELRADAQALQALVGSPAAPRGPGIPPAPQPNQPVTFTRAQMQDAAFVRANKLAIMQAAREGRIVNS